MRIDAPGLHRLSAEEYHADPCPYPSLSASIARELLHRSPMHAWAAHPRLNPTWCRRQASDEMDEGTLVHWMLFGGGKRPVIVEADDWRTKAAQQLRASAREQGRVAVLGRRYRELRRAAVAIRRELRATVDLPEGIEQGVPEAVLCWQEGDLWCRCMVDWLPTGVAVLPPLVDLKTTRKAATAEQFARSAVDLGMDIQAAWYRRGYRAVFGREPGPMVFIAAEIEPPYGVSRLALGAELEELGEQKVEAALEIWRTCMNRQDWPGYPRRVAFIAAPRFASPTWESQAERGKQQIKDGSRRRASQAAIARTARIAQAIGGPVA